MLSLKGNSVTDPDLKATINGNALSTVESVTYFWVTFARNVKWTNHDGGIFRKCVHLSFFCKETSKNRLVNHLPGRTWGLSRWGRAYLVGRQRPFGGRLSGP